MKFKFPEDIKKSNLSNTLNGIKNAGNMGIIYHPNEINNNLKILEVLECVKTEFLGIDDYIFSEYPIKYIYVRDLPDIVLYS